MVFAIGLTLHGPSAFAEGDGEWDEEGGGEWAAEGDGEWAAEGDGEWAAEGDENGVWRVTKMGCGG